MSVARAVEPRVRKFQLFCEMHIYN